MKALLTTITLGVAVSSFAGGNGRISKQEYVDQWSGTAVEQMIEHGIPASITLAQGILESASGNSKLAIKGNNHFGIKCHGWKGKKIYKDDDKKNECFRVYKSAEESYQDHSLFLKKYDRYAFLFTYESDDYKSWAKGLKKAGYATNSKYPQLLIGIIEDLELDKYDQMSKVEIDPQPIFAFEETEETESTVKPAVEATEVAFNNHDVNTHKKGVRYVVAKKGDTFYAISKEFGLTLGQLYRFNDFDQQKDVLETGDIVYIQAKKRRNLFKKEEVVANEEISLLEFSQIHATNASSIRRLNGYDDAKVIAKGEKVTLR